MADLSNSSFIPKRGPVKQKKRASSKQVYVFTVVSYMILFASLLGVAGVFFYTKHVESQFNEAVAELADAIEVFSDSDMERVIEFDSRIEQASSLLEGSVSTVSIFEALEGSIIDTAQIDSLKIERTPERSMNLLASIETDSFDSTIFQRETYKITNGLDSVVIKNVTRSELGEAEDGELQEAGDVFNFSAEIEIPFASVMVSDAIYDNRLSGLSSIEDSNPTIINEESEAFDNLDGELDELNETES